MTTRRALLKMGSVATLATVGLPQFIRPAAAQTTKLRMQTIIGPGTTSTKSFELFASKVKSRTNGAVDIATLPLGAVVGANDTLDSVRNGVLDGQYTSAVYFAGKDPAFALLGDTLSAYPDPLTRDRWFYEAGGLQLARDFYARQGLFFIGPVYWAPEWMPMRKPVQRLDDFKGLKIRMPEGLAGDLMKRIGASVVTLPFPEVSNALQTGVLDGADMASMSINLSTGIHAIAKHAVFARHAMVTTDVSMSLNKWKTLSPQQQKIMEEEVRAFSEQHRMATIADEKVALEKAKEIGVAMTELPSADQLKFRALALAVMDDWGKRNATCAKIVESHRAYLKKLSLI